jgi:hypothetical protein
LSHDDRADRYVPVSASDVGLVEGKRHPVVVVICDGGRAVECHERAGEMGERLKGK